MSVINQYNSIQYIMHPYYISKNVYKVSYFKYSNK